MEDRPNGEDPEPAGDEEDFQTPYIQAGASGGTITAGRPENQNAAMEQKFQEAESVGFRIESRTRAEIGTYYWFQDQCDPPHVGSVAEHEVYAVVVDKILRRCPKWKAWKKDQEREEGP